MAAACVAVAAAFAAGRALADTPAIAGPAATPSATATRIDPVLPAVVISDSALAALEWVPGAAGAVRGFPHVLDLKACRRLFEPSCGSPAPTTAYEALANYGRVQHTLILSVGYNDLPAFLPASFDRVVERARTLGYERIVWMTLRSDPEHVSSGYRGSHRSFAERNALVAGSIAVTADPEIVVADWSRYSWGRTDWFVSDGVHFRAPGAWAAADYLSRKMAFLDGRPCPMPVRPGVPVDDPCPDPDVTGPIADLSALYPSGAATSAAIPSTAR